MITGDFSIPEIQCMKYDAYCLFNPNSNGYIYEIKSLF